MATSTEPALRLVFMKGENEETDFMAPYKMVVYQLGGEMICLKDPTTLYRFKGGKPSGIYFIVTASELAKMTRTCGYKAGEFRLTPVWFAFFNIKFKVVELSYNKVITPSTKLNYFGEAELCPFFDEPETRDWVYSYNFAKLRDLLKNHTKLAV